MFRVFIGSHNMSTVLGVRYVSCFYRIAQYGVHCPRFLICFVFYRTTQYGVHYLRCPICLVFL